MKGKQVGLVMAALIAIGIAGLVLRVVSQASAPSTLSGLFPVSEDVIDRVTIRSRDQLAQVTKEGPGEWRVGTRPVFDLKLARFWATVGRLGTAQLVAENPANHARLGVSPKDGTLVSFYTGWDIVEKLLIGKSSSQAQLSYLRRPQEDAVYSLPFDLTFIFDPDPNGWRNPIVLNIPPDQVESISFLYPEASFILQRYGPDWSLVSAEGEALADSQEVQGVLQLVELLITSDFASDDEAKEINFDNPDAAVALTTTGSTRPIGVKFLEKDAYSYFVRTTDQTTVFIVDREIAEGLLKTEEDFLGRAGS